MTTPEPSASDFGDPVAAAAAFLDRLPKPQPVEEPEPEPEESEQEEPQDVLTLSYSQLSTFQECEWRWYLENALHTPRVPNVADVVGHALHAAFAQALTVYRDTETLPTDADVIDAAIVAFYLQAANVDPDDVYLDAKLMTSNELRMVAICRVFAAYIRRLASRADAPLHPVFIEERFNIAHPSDASIRLRGTVDLVTERDGMYAGVDWKSGRWFTAETAQKTLQTESYLLGAGRMAMSEEGQARGWRQLASFTYVSFPYDELDQVAQIKPYASPRPPQRIQGFLTTLARTAGDMRLKREHASYKPHLSSACARCEVLHACERGQKWLTSHNITPRPTMLIAPPKPERREESHDDDSAE